MLLTIVTADGEIQWTYNVLKVVLTPIHGEEIARLKRDDLIWEIHSDCYALDDDCDTSGTKGDPE
jgi:hypothetical protein